MKKIGVAALTLALAMGTVSPAMIVEAKEASVTALAKNFAESTDVPLDKRWTITFNKAVSKNADLEKFVYVEDSAKNKVPIEISINTARTKVYVEPIEKYKAGETYQLMISQALTSESGKKLKDTVVKKFTTIGAKQVFQQSYKVTNTTNEEQEVTVGKGAYFQIINEDGTTAYYSGYDVAEDIPVILAAGETLYCDFLSHGTVQSTTLNNNIIEVKTPFFKVVDLKANEAFELFAMNTERVNLYANVGTNNQVVYSKMDSYHGYVENEYMSEERYTNRIELSYEDGTVVENLGNETVQLIMPKQYVSYEKTTKHTNMVTYDLAPNEIVEITEDGLNTSTRQSTPLHIIVKDNINGYGKFDYVHQYSYDSKEFGLNYWNTIQTQDNQMPDDLYYFFDKNIFFDSVFKMKNTGSSTLRLYGEYMAFKKTDEALHSTYTIQPHEKVAVDTSLIGDRDSFYVTQDGVKKTMNVFLANDEEVAYMGEMTVNNKDIRLPIYDKTIIENTSDKPIDIYGSKRTISFENVTTQTMPYKQIVVKPSERYYVEHNNGQYSNYLIGTENGQSGMYDYGYYRYFEDDEEWGTGVYDEEIEASDADERMGYSEEYGFYQLAKDKRSVEGDEWNYIENTGSTNLILYVPDDGIIATKNN